MSASGELSEAVVSRKAMVSELIKVQREIARMGTVIDKLTANELPDINEKIGFLPDRIVGKRGDFRTRDSFREELKMLSRQLGEVSEQLDMAGQTANGLVAVLEE